MDGATKRKETSWRAVGWPIRTVVVAGRGLVVRREKGKGNEVSRWRLRGSSHGAGKVSLRRGKGNGGWPERASCEKREREDGRGLAGEEEGDRPAKEKKEVGRGCSCLPKGLAAAAPNERGLGFLLF